MFDKSNLTEAEFEMFNDFYQEIKEWITDYGVESSDELIKRIMTRVNQQIVESYKQWGINDTEVRDEIGKVVREVLIMRGQIK